MERIYDHEAQIRSLKQDLEIWQARQPRRQGERAR